MFMTTGLKETPSPFFLKGGPVGIILIHGFTGAPPEMRFLGDYLNDKSITVSGPMLPGHGTFVEDMNKYKWKDWIEHIHQEIAKLSECCDTVFVGGLSLGSVIALKLAADLPNIGGAILYSPAIKLASRMIYLTPFLKYLVKKVQKPVEIYANQQADRQNWSYNERPMAAAHELLKIIQHTNKLLPKVKSPLLMIQSKMDATIDSQSSQIIYNRVKSTDKEIVMLEKSGHCLTIDIEWEQAAEKSYQFIQRQLEVKNQKQ